MPAKKNPARNAATPNKAGSASGTDLDLVRNLANILNETGLSEIEFDQRGTRVRVSKNSGPATHAPIVQASVPQAGVPAAQTPMVPAEARHSAAGDSDHAGTVKSPMVGTAYLAPSPGAARFIDVGSQVKAGQTLLIIEAMKTMNQIHSPTSGKVVKIHIENGDPVEFGAALVTIE